MIYDNIIDKKILRVVESSLDEAITTVSSQWNGSHFYYNSGRPPIAKRENSSFYSSQPICEVLPKNLLLSSCGQASSSSPTGICQFFSTRIIVYEKVPRNPLDAVHGGDVQGGKFARMFPATPQHTEGSACVRQQPDKWTCLRPAQPDQLFHTTAVRIPASCTAMDIRGARLNFRPG